LKLKKVKRFIDSHITSPFLANARIGRKGTPKEIKELELELRKYDNEDLRNELLIKKDFKKAKENKEKADEIKKELTELHDKYRSETVIRINKDMVADIIAIKTGIPARQLSADENQKYLNLASEIKMEVIGQDDAINKIVKSIKRTATGLNDPNRPNGVFLLLGSTGVGKTHTVKMLAKYLYGSEKKLIRVDMSEYAAEHTVARMIGSPPGYVGYGEGGQLTEKVRHNPNSVILFDEIEKAHPKIFDIFLQIFDDGQLTDGEGVVVDFKNTTIIMTSNIGSAQVANLVNTAPKSGFGFNTKDDVAIEASNKEKAKQVMMDELNKHFKPEFLNRIDDIVIFSKLSTENITKIIDIEIAKVQKKLDDRKLTLELSPSFKELLIDKGYDKEMGARPLKRTIQNYLENPISDEILKGNLKEGDTIFVDYNKQKDETYINNNLVEEKKKYIITNFKKFNS
jgi:ATP-dependent Clp protease ATP-binding subunit ClpC